MLTTPAGSSSSTACGIISCAVTHTMQPAAALSSHGSAAPTCSARAKASNAPSGSTSPDAAPARNARSRVQEPWASGRLTAAPSGIFCRPMPRLSASAPLMASGSPVDAMAAASPATMPSGRLCKVTARIMRPLCPAPPASSCPANCSTCKRPTAPSTSPIADGIHAGNARLRPRSMAGSKRLHTLAASIMPAAMPHKIRCVQGRACRRSKNTPAAPNVVHAAGNSSTHAVKIIRFKTAFPLCPLYVRKGKKVQNCPEHPEKAFPCDAPAASAPEILSALFLSGAKPYSAGFIQTNYTTLPPS